MTESEFSWTRAWRSARAKQAADAPRQASIRDSIDAVRGQNLPSDTAVRTALIREFGQRGVAVEEPTIDLLVPMARTSPLGATLFAARELFSHVRNTVGTLQDLADPGWTRTPDGIPDISEWREDQEEIAAAVTWTTDAERAVVDRLIADVREQRDDDGRPVRVVACWLSIDGAAVRVNVGKLAVGTIDVPSARTVIARHGGRKRSVGTFAELYGDTTETATLTVFVPDRP